MLRFAPRCAKPQADGCGRLGEASERKSPTDSEVLGAPCRDKGIAAVGPQAERCATWRAALPAVPEVLVPMLEYVAKDFDGISDIRGKHSETMLNGSLH